MKNGIRIWNANKYRDDAWVVTNEKTNRPGANKTKCTNRQKPKKRKGGS